MIIDRSRIRIRSLFVLVVSVQVLAFHEPCIAWGEEPISTTPKPIRRYSTLHSIGIEWDIQGDSNHNAVCKVEYRKVGRGEWSKAMNLLRIDYHGYYDKSKADRRYNMLAGSIFFLKSGTTYEVRLSLTDPDGGGTVEEFSIETWSDLTLPTGGRTLHVVPGDGGGTGTKTDPLLGLTFADQQAKSGDVFLLHEGDYGTFSPRTSGQSGKRIVWKPAGDGQVDIHHLNIYANHLWLEGFQITRISEAARNGVRDRINATGIVLRRNRIEGFHYGVLVGRYEATNWIITDNIIVGDKDWATGKGFGSEHSSGEGIELNHSSNHVVCYNTISKVADGISYPGRNCDMYGNDIFEVSDDGLEPDYGYANNRMWGNRIQETHKAGISIQPMLCSPWYFIRNQIVSDTTMLKMRVCDRFVMINNTFIVGKGGVGGAYNLLNCVSRNNIWYGVTHNDYLWIAHVAPEDQLTQIRRYINYPKDETGFLPNWGTDLDYDAFGKKQNPPGQFAGDVFGWYDRKNKRQTHFRSVKDFSKFLGVEKHGIHFDAKEVFEKWDIPDDRSQSSPGGKVQDLPPQLLTLKAKSQLIDSGDRLPNIHDDWFSGKAPDIGAHERGMPLPHYGARDDKLLNEHAEYWVLKKER